jgi:hypothetical protein
VRFKLAILNVLAKCPDGRATMDEVRREVRVIIASGDQTEQLKRFSEFGDIDIFESGLVLRDDAGLQITDDGLSLLHSLSSEPSLEFSSAPVPQPFENPLSMEERLRTLDLEPRMPGNDAQDGDYDNHRQSAHDKESRKVAIEAPGPMSQIGAVDRSESFDTYIRKRRQKLFLELGRLIAFIAAGKRSIFDRGRRYFAQQTSRASNGRSDRLVRTAGGAAFALLSLALVVACVVAAIAFGQIQSLKSEVAALRRELLPVRERIVKLEQIEKERRDLDQQEEAQNRPDVKKNKPDGEIRTDQTALNLSREEIRLIRDYIKPAPSADTAAPAINVGDPVGGATIPLPSPVTEKIPKLLGGRFTTRNGAIIIIKHDSHQADAVLPSQ